MRDNNGPAQLVKQIRDSLEYLGRLTDDAAKSETIRKYLELCSRFHQYSFSNQILILLQYPEATHVAGFLTWQKLGRSIRKGSKAIRILAPVIYKREKEIKDENGDVIEMEEEKVVRYFISVCVFDIQQTTGGKPLPTPDIEITGNTHQKLLQSILDYIHKQGITVIFKKTMGGTLGYTTQNKLIVVDVTLSPNQQIETLLHELAHQKLQHFQNNGSGCLSKKDMELEASATAYVVCKHHNLDTKNPNYLALWDADSRRIKEHMERISENATEIVRGIESNT